MSPTVAELREGIVQGQTQVAQAQQVASVQEQRIQEAKKRLTSQQALRGGIGLKERKEGLSQVQQAEQNISQYKEDVGQYETQLVEQEKAITQYEAQNKAESYPGESQGITYRQYKHSLTHRPISSGEVVKDYTYFDPNTGLGYSSQYDLTSKGYVKTLPTIKDTFISSDKDLNIKNNFLDYAKSNGTSGLYTWKSSGIPSSKLVSTIPINDSSGFLANFQKGIKDTKETYDPTINAFVVSPQPSDTGTKIISRTATIEERQQMDVIKNPVTRYIFGDTISGNIMTTNLGELRGKIKESEILNTELESRSKEIEKLSQNLNTPEQIENYNQKINEYEQKRIRQESLTIGAGLFGLREQIPVSELSDIKYGGISTFTTIVGKTGGKTLGLFASGVATEMGLKESQEVTSDIKLPYFSRGTIQTDASGKPITSIEMTSNVPNLISPSNLKKTGEFVGGLAPYANPLGGYIYAAKEGEALYGYIKEQYKPTYSADWNLDKDTATLGNKTKYGNIWGAIGLGSLNYAKERPFEVIALATLGFLKGKKVVNKATGTGKYKYDKYLENPETKDLLLNRKIVQNTYPEQNLVPKLEIVQENNVARINTPIKNKGVTQVTESYPTNTLTGNIIEQRDLTGKSGFFNRLFGKGDKNLKSYKGNIYLDENKALEIINYDKNIKKVTEIDLKTNKGVTRLYEGDKLLKEAKVESTNVQDILGNIKKRTNVLEIDQQVRNPVATSDINLRLGNMEIKNLKTLEVGGEVYNNMGSIIKEPYLTSTKLTGKITTNIEQASNIERGIFRSSSESSGNLDLIQVGARKGKVEVNMGNKYVKIAKRANQEIVYGNPNEVDKVTRIVSGDKSKTLRIISPKVNREISQLAESQLRYSYINPNSKILNVAKEIEALKVKGNKEMATNVANTLKQNRMFDKFKEIKEAAKNQILKIKNIGKSPKGASNIRFGQEEAEVLQSMSGRVIVERPSAYLSNVNIPEVSNVPLLSNIAEEAEIVGGNIGVGLGSKGKYVGALNIIPKQETKLETFQAQVTELDLKPALENKQTNKQISTLKQTPIIKQEFKSELKLNQVEQLRVLENLKLETKQELKQQAKQRLEPKQDMKQRNQERWEPKPSTEIVIPKPTSLVKRLANKVQESPDIFEILVTKGGKDISIGKRRSLEEAESLLGKTLKGTLRAGGSILKGGKKLEAKELGLLKSAEYSISKINPFKIIQKKEKRLGTRSETSEIQMFKKKSPSKKRKLNLFD